MGSNEAERLLGLLQFKEAMHDNDNNLNSATVSNASSVTDCDTSNSDSCIQGEETSRGYGSVPLFEAEEQQARQTKKLKRTTRRHPVPRIDTDDIFIDPDNAIVSTKGEVWLLPDDIAQAMIEHSFEPEPPQITDEDLVDTGKYTDDEWVEHVLPKGVMPEDTFLEYIAKGTPGYYTIITKDEKPKVYPVYGYLADLGMRAAASPVIDRSVDNNWDDCEYLCRCAQCGRELPPSYYFINTSGRPKGICRGCTSVNRTADTLFAIPRRYWRPHELKFMSRISNLYCELWALKLAPRGAYAEHILGRAEVRSRIASTRYIKKKDSIPHIPSEHIPPRTGTVPVHQISRQMEYLDSIDPTQ